MIETSYDQLGAYPLVKMFLYFEILTGPPILNLVFVVFFVRINIVFSIRIRFNINRFHFNSSMICVIVFINNII